MPLHTDVACALCGCLCDDLLVEVQGDQIVRAERACPVALSVFEKLNTLHPAAASLRGTACSTEEAISAAVEMLRDSRAPLIFGLGHGATEGQRAAIKLAEQLGAVIDTAGTPLTRASLLAMQQVGFSTCTLGEVKQRADLVIFWGADPAKTHPRHLERYSAESVSEFLPRGRADRTLVTIHHQETVTEREADVKLRIPPGSDAEIISVLRQLIRNENWQPPLPQPSPAGGEGEFTGTLLEQLRDLARRLKTCRYGTIFFGPGLLGGNTSHLTVQSLFRLVSELNAFTRFTVRALGNPGAENVLAWQTGFAFAVDFQQGFPRYQPGEFSAGELLERRAVDSCVVIDSDCLSHLSTQAKNVLTSLPTIVLDPPHQAVSWEPSIRFITALPGVQTSGTAYRMDDVALPLRKLYDSPYPTTEEILTGISISLNESPWQS